LFFVRAARSGPKDARHCSIIAGVMLSMRSSPKRQEVSLDDRAVVAHRRGLAAALGPRRSDLALDLAAVGQAVLRVPHGPANAIDAVDVAGRRLRTWHDPRDSTSIAETYSGHTRRTA
jgi:hypothetical protein